MRTLFLLCLAIFSGTLPCQAVDYHVNGATGQDTSTCGPLTQPCKTVKRAVDNAGTITPVTVKIATGTYSEYIELYDYAFSPDLTLQGGWNQDFTHQQCDPGLTVLEQPDNESYLLYSHSDKTRSYTLRLSCLTLREDMPTTGEDDLLFFYYGGQAKLTFTMKNCLLDGYQGAGVRTWTAGNASLNASIADTIFRNGHTVGQLNNGAGVGIISSDNSVQTLTMKNCLLNNNSASHGGGIDFHPQVNGRLTAYLINITVTNNQATENGGGIYAVSRGDATLTVNLTNVIIHGNSVNGAGNDIYLRKYHNSSTTINTRYSIIGEVVNHGATWNDNGHNLEVDPHLNSSYHLRSDSPAIDAGICGKWLYGWKYTRLAPYFDIDGDPRPPFPALTGCDIGADEYVRDSLCFPVKAKNGTTAIICL
ncbi:MAG: hypothetical protein CSA34_02375 [Desulfobulbus propionicus]|nr:MAG: hypothetical protein CSA34_02375 [Desulfobulbus propionicus]